MDRDSDRTGTTLRCDHCGVEFVEQVSPEGLCPRCLFSAACSAGAGHSLNEPSTAGPSSPPVFSGNLRRLALGTYLGPYEIVASLGEGGMGHVYKARDTRLHRTVAIKVLPTRVAAGVSLQREAQLIANFNHPHICALYDVGEREDLTFLVLEYLEGPTLAERLGQGPLPIDQVLRYAVQIADALDNAHRRGVVHRDLKPSNIVLTKSGAKVLDFGLAQLGPAEPMAALTDDFFTLFEGGASDDRRIAGTVQYMSPEQMEGKDADPRSDLFSFGLTLYEMITGRRAFDSDSETSLVVAILSSEALPISTHRADVPPALERLVEHCLTKDPADRWQAARDVLLQLKHLAENLASPPTAPAPLRRSPSPLASVTAVLAVVMLGMELVGLRGPLTAVYAGVVRFTPAPPAWPGPGGEGPSAALVSPDGTRVAWRLSNGERKTSLAVQDLRSPSVVYLAGTEGAHHAFWSPDSRDVAFFAGGQLKRVHASGGPIETIASAPGGRGGTWSHAGTIVFAPDVKGVLYRVSIDGGPVRPVTSLDRNAGETSHEWPTFLPDGRHVVYVALGSRQTLPALYVADIDAPTRRYLGRADSGATYAPPGYLVFVLSRMLVAMPFDARHLRITGRQIVVQQEIHEGYAPGSRFFSTSDNGVLLYHTLRTPPAQLTWFDREGHRLAAAGTAAPYRNPALSPDGREIAAERPGADGRLSSLWAIDLVRGTTTRLTETRPASTPVWSPDGRTLVFASNDGPPHHLYSIPARGGQQERLIESPVDLVPTDWSPADGRALLYERIEGGDKSDLWVLPLAGDRIPIPYVHTGYNARQARFSPNSRWVAYCSDESGRFEVYVQSFPRTGAKWQISTDGGSQPVWREDGRELFYLAEGQNPKMMAASVVTDGMRFRVGRPHILFELASRVTAGARSSYSSAMNGTRFLVNIETGTGSTSGPVANVVLNWHTGIGQ